MFYQYVVFYFVGLLLFELLTRGIVIASRGSVSKKKLSVFTRLLVNLLWPFVMLLMIFIGLFASNDFMSKYYKGEE